MLFLVVIELLFLFVSTCELRLVNTVNQKLLDRTADGNIMEMNNLLSERQTKSGSGASVPSLTDINPEIGNDLTKVTWAHGVNSKKELRRALRGNAMMIEADVFLGKLKTDLTSEKPKRPVMAHPPIKTSDLTLEDFLDQVLDASELKGIKLDFKSTSVLEQAFQIVKSRESLIDVPLWLNADIIQGPVSSTTDPIKPQVFLNLCKLHFPFAVISVGWTTKFGKEGFYSFEHVRQMRDALQVANILQPVTFPIRAGLSTSVESQKNILWLLNQVPQSTVTIWGSFGDEVDVGQLLDLIDSIGSDRVYLDVQSGLSCRISRYRMFYRATSWLGLWSLGRAGRLSLATGALALLTYVTCATSFLPWNTNSYNVQ